MQGFRTASSRPCSGLFALRTILNGHRGMQSYYSQKFHDVDVGVKLIGDSIRQLEAASTLASKVIDILVAMQ